MTHPTAHQTNLWNGSSADRVSRSSTEYRILVMEQDTTARRRYAEALIAVPPGAGVAYRIITVGSIAAAQLQAARQRFHLLIAALPSSHNGVEELVERLRDLYRSDIALLLLQDGMLDAAQFEWANALGARLAERTVVDEVLRATVAELLGLRDMHQEMEPTQKSDEGTITSSLAESPTSANQRRMLDNLLEDADGLLVVYADTNGHIIAQSGDATGIDLAALVPLLASNLMYAPHVSHVLHDTVIAHLAIHEGANYDVYVASAGNDRLVALLFDKIRFNPDLGFLWPLIKSCIQQLHR